MASRAGEGVRMSESCEGQRVWEQGVAGSAQVGLESKRGSS